MNKKEILNVLYELASPLAMILAGLLLVFCPDAATVLVSRLLGWGITLVGIGFGIGAIVNRRKAISRGVTAVGLACIGGFLSANPLVLAAVIGKVIGLLIFLRGLWELFLAGRQGYGQILAVIVTVAGLALILLPMTASRLLFAGVMMLLSKFRHHRLPPDRPDIIDV